MKCPGGKIINPRTGRCVNKNSPVLKKSYKLKERLEKIKKEGPQGPQEVSNVNNILVYCDKNKYINPKTGRCVLKTNKDIFAYLQKGYKLGVKNQVIKGPQGPQGPQGPLVPIINKVPINTPKPDVDVKILVPPKDMNVIKLVKCGVNKVINPKTGRCVMLTSKIGQQLTSKPYILINAPSGPQKEPYFIPKIKPQKIDKKNPAIGLDTDGDNYVSIREYLDAVESKADKEKSSKDFAFYNQRDLGIVFLLKLIKKQKGPISKIACIPPYALCIHKNNQGVYYTVKSIKSPDGLIDYSCDRKPSDFYTGSYFTRGSIYILNAEYNSKIKYLQKTNIGKTLILTPPNFSETIKQCEIDNKYMVVCDLTLLSTENVRETSHANALIIDIRRKTIERFDPHGSNQYKLAKLAYDPDNLLTDRKDFKFGNLPNKVKNNLEEKLIESNALFNQEKIDEQLKTKMKELLPEYVYYGTNYTTPYLGPQIKSDAYDGLCVTWSTMYMVLRLLNPDLNPAEITLRMIDGRPKDILNRVLRFQKFIIRVLSN